MVGLAQLVQPGSRPIFLTAVLRRSQILTGAAALL